MSNLRVTVDLNNVDPKVDVTDLARKIGEVVRNVTGSEVQVDIKDTPATIRTADRYRKN